LQFTQLIHDVQRQEVKDIELGGYNLVVGNRLHIIDRRELVITFPYNFDVTLLLIPSTEE
jgi:hypothetical protein